MGAGRGGRTRRPPVAKARGGIAARPGEGKSRSTKSGRIDRDWRRGRSHRNERLPLSAAPSLCPIGAPPLRARAWQRAAIGLGQGLALWLLYRAGQSHAWPATQPLLLGPLLLGLLFVPVLAVVGLGNLQRRTLVSWLLCAFLVLAIVGAHDLTRNQTPAVEPTIGVVIAIAFALFIAHTLVTAADIDRRPVAAYPTYFEAAWKHTL